LGFRMFRSELEENVTSLERFRMLSQPMLLLLGVFIVSFGTRRKHYVLGKVQNAF
jgi:hypothetical protein